MLTQDILQNAPHPSGAIEMAYGSDQSPTRSSGRILNYCHLLTPVPVSTDYADSIGSDV